LSIDLVPLPAIASLRSGWKLGPHRLGDQTKIAVADLDEPEAEPISAKHLSLGVRPRPHGLWKINKLAR
jgi:hypothetical protein